MEGGCKRRVSGETGTGRRAACQSSSLMTARHPATAPRTKSSVVARQADAALSTLVVVGDGAGAEDCASWETVKVDGGAVMDDVEASNDEEGVDDDCAFEEEAWLDEEEDGVWAE